MINLTDALEKQGFVLEPKAPGSWRVSGDPVRDVQVELGITSRGFLGVGARLPESRADLLELLKRNATLPGNVKFGLKGECAWYLEDIPAPAAGFDPVVVAESIRAVACLAAGHEVKESAGGVASSDTVRVLSESSWKFQERSEGRYSVELQTHDGRQKHALAEVRGAGLRLRVSFVNLEDLPEESVLAIAHMLARLSGTLRYARPVVDRNDTPVFEVNLKDSFEEGDLAEGLFALIAAVDACEAELADLAHVGIAREYLAFTHAVAGGNRI